MSTRMEIISRFYDQADEDSRLKRSRHGQLEYAAVTRWPLMPVITVPLSSAALTRQGTQPARYSSTGLTRSS